MDRSAPSSTAVVIGGGPIAATDVRFDVIIAADSGLDVALAAGLRPHHLVGDLDSISATGLAWAEANEVNIDRHPPDKNDTDTALAVQLAVRLGTDQLTLFGPATTDRLDHLLGALISLGDLALGDLESITANLGSTIVHIIHGGHSVTIDRASGSVFSLLALHGPCSGVDVDGARWPLTAARLVSGSTLGISNESRGLPIRVSIETGVLTVIVPEVAS